MLQFPVAKKVNEEQQKRVIAPLVSIEETEKNVVLAAEMPGLKKEDIMVEATGEELIIRGSRTGCEIPDGYTVLFQERCPLEYRRAFVLGQEVDREKISADYENGVLRVTLMKSVRAQPRKIAIT